MKFLQKAPALVIFISLISGLILYDKFDLSFACFLSAIVFVAIGINFFTYERDQKNIFNILFAVVFLIIMISFRIYFVISSPNPEAKIIKNEIGIFTLIRSWGRSYVGVLNSESGNFVIKMPFANYVEGMRIKFNGISRPFKNNNNNSGFDEAKYWRAKNVEGWINICNVEDLPEKFNLYRMRYLISRWLNINLPDLCASYLNATLLGERDLNLNNNHRKWGTSHLLAVSGFHVGIIILCAGYFIKNNLILSFILWAYILLTGCAPSALRAGIMLQAGILSRSIWRKPSGLNNVSLAGIILLIHSPFIYWDISWRLSILAAITLTSFGNNKFSWIFINPIISITTFDQIAFTFGKIPAVGIILNLFAPLYFSFGFSIASISALIKFLKVPFIADIFLISSEGIFKLYEIIANYFLNLIPFEINYNNFLAMFGDGILIFLVCNKLGFSRRRAFFMSTFVCFLNYYII